MTVGYSCGWFTNMHLLHSLLEGNGYTICKKNLLFNLSGNKIIVLLEASRIIFPIIISFLLKPLRSFVRLRVKWALRTQYFSSREKKETNIVENIWKHYVRSSVTIIVLVLITVPSFVLAYPTSPVTRNAGTLTAKLYIFNTKMAKAQPFCWPTFLC